MELNATQPLLQGAGVRVNLAPIEIARIDTERSFFQLKDAVQEMVRGVIEAYWALVLARTDLWVREQQIIQATAAYDLADGETPAWAWATWPKRPKPVRRWPSSRPPDHRPGQRAVAGGRAAQHPGPAPVGADADRPGQSRRRPSACRSIGTAIVDVASERRPDLVELKLILEADQQRLIMADNDALPSVDLNGLYRWNGLEGRTPDREIVSSAPGQFTDWQLGVNFSVPLGLRQARAALRQRELVILRDRANLEQGLHNAIHSLGRQLPQPRPVLRSVPGLPGSPSRRPEQPRRPVRPPTRRVGRST